MGVDSQDVDNDGYPDLVFVALDNETFPLFRNTGKRGFVDATLSSGLGRLSLPMAGYSPNIADFDNDGWKDLFVSRGHVQSPGSANRMQIDQPNTVFRNTGGLKFEALTAEAGLGANGRPDTAARPSAISTVMGAWTSWSARLRHPPRSGSTTPLIAATGWRSNSRGLQAIEMVLERASK